MLALILKRAKVWVPLGLENVSFWDMNHVVKCEKRMFNKSIELFR